MADDDEGCKEEYIVWKKNSPYLYDLVLTHDMDWPSITVQWLPGVNTTADGNIHKLLLGTHTSNNEPNYLMVAEVRVGTWTINN